MSVRRARRRDPHTGRVNQYWMVDIDYQPLTGESRRIRRKAPVQTKRGAEQYERELRQALADGTLERKEEALECPTLAVFETEFIDNYARVHNTPGEVETKQGIFKRYLTPTLGHLKLDAITTRKIERLKAKLMTRGLNPKTVNNAIGVLGKCLRWAHEIELLDSVPKIRKLKAPPTKFDFLTFDEADKLLKAAEYNPEWHAMIFIALRTGLRFGELSELRWSDIDLTNGVLMVSRSHSRGHTGPPKSGKFREIQLSDQTIEFLKQHRHLKGELVFCKDDGGRHIHRRADVALKRCCKYAELRPIGWHTLRHTFASHLVMRGARLKEVQELLGHSTIEMTMRYSHLTPDVKRDAVALLDVPTQVQRQNSGYIRSRRVAAENQKSPKRAKAQPISRLGFSGVDGTRTRTMGILKNLSKADSYPVSH